MAPTPLTATVRYVPYGKRKIYWVTTIATQASPTRVEIDAGKDLTAEIAEMSGFTVTSDTVDTPDLGSSFTSKQPARTTADDSSITFYATSNSADVRTVLPRGTAGFVLCLWEGDVATQKMDVFPVSVASCSLDTSIDDPGRVVVQFTVTKVPSQSVAIPA